MKVIFKGFAKQHHLNLCHWAFPRLLYAPHLLFDSHPPLSMLSEKQRRWMDSSYVLIQTILTAKVAQLRAVFFHQVSVCEAHAFRVGRSTFWAKILAFSCKKRSTGMAVHPCVVWSHLVPTDFLSYTHCKGSCSTNPDHWRTLYMELRACRVAVLPRYRWKNFFKNIC